MKTILLSLLFGFCLTITQAQEPTDDEDVPSKKKISHYLGLNAGFSTGVGLSTVFWGADHGLQFTFLPIFTSSISRYSAGITYLNKLKEGKYANLHLFVGGHMTNLNDDDDFLIIGVGPGVELSPGDVSIFLRAGYASYIQPGDFWLLPTVETGFFYKF